MSSLSGSFRETNIATIAAMITLVDAHLTAENARMIALGGAATGIVGNLALTIRAKDGPGNIFSHKISVTINCAALANTATLTAALSVLATAVETQSAFTTVIEVDAAMNVTMTN